jgi:hypothetical protein
MRTVSAAERFQPCVAREMDLEFWIRSKLSIAAIERATYRFLFVNGGLVAHQRDLVLELLATDGTRADLEHVIFFDVLATSCCVDEI